MASVNKVFILGNLGTDPDVRYTASDNRAICTLSIATTRRTRTMDGESVSETEWHRVVAFGRTAEVAKDYLRKGSPVYVEGRLRTRKWQDKNGQDRYTTEVVVETLQLLGGRRDDERHERPAPSAPAHNDGHDDFDPPF